MSNIRATRKVKKQNKRDNVCKLLTEVVASGWLIKLFLQDRIEAITANLQQLLKSHIYLQRHYKNRELYQTYISFPVTHLLIMESPNCMQNTRQRYEMHEALNSVSQTFNTLGILNRVCQPFVKTNTCV